MAYTTNTFNIAVVGIGSAPSIWTYTSTDAHTTIDDTGYFSDGASKGLKATDIVLVTSGTASIAACTVHVAISATSVLAATLS